MPVERHFHMGTNRAELAADRRHLYATIRSARRAPFQAFGQCQVSGHIETGAKPASLFQCSEPFPPRLLPGVICADRMSQDAVWPICAPGGIGPRRFSWRDSNVRDSKSAGKLSPKLNWACARSATNGSRASKRSLAFPSSSFFRRRCRIWTRSWVNVSPGICPIAMPQGSPGTHAKS